MKAFVLTCEELDSGLRKRGFCTQYLSSYEFVQGVSKYSIDDYLGIMSNPFDFGFGNCLWDEAAAAICYGHYAIWKKVVQHNETCLVLEDDVYVLPRIFYLDDYINNNKLYDNFSLLSLWKTGVGNYINHNQFYDQAISSYANSGALGYVLTPETAKFLIANFQHIQEPIDHYILGSGSLKNSNYSVYVTKEDIVVHKNGVSLREM